jgi:hypothetical protein
MKNFQRKCPLKMLPEFKAKKQRLSIVVTTYFCKKSPCVAEGEEKGEITAGA